MTQKTTPHILIVEDDASSRAMLALRLQHAGYQVTQAAGGEEAFDLLEKEAFNVVLTDIFLGDIDGIEVLYTARRHASRPAVILLTGHSTLDTAIAAVRAGAHDYLQKPCSDSEMMRCIETAVQRHATECQLKEAVEVITTIYDQTMREEPLNLPAPQQASNSPLQQQLEPAPQSAHPGFPPAGQKQHVLVGALSIGPTRHEVLFENQPVHLTPLEHALLLYLAQRAGQVCRFNDIVRYTHGIETDEADAQNLVKSHIHNLRKKISSAYLVNDRGTGYKLVAPPPESNAHP